MCQEDLSRRCYSKSVILIAGNTSHPSGDNAARNIHGVPAPAAWQTDGRKVRLSAEV